MVGLRDHAHICLQLYWPGDLGLENVLQMDSLPTLWLNLVAFSDRLLQSPAIPRRLLASCRNHRGASAAPVSLFDSGISNKEGSLYILVQIGESNVHFSKGAFVMLLKGQVTSSSEGGSCGRLIAESEFAFSD